MAGITQDMLSKSFREKLLPAWNKHPRYLDDCGGARSGKTFSVLQMLVLRAAHEEALGLPKTITSVVSETLPHLKRGAIRDFQTIMSAADYWDDAKWNKTDAIYTFDNGSIIEFFSADAPAKVHGPARDHLFINECQNVPYEVARQLFIRTKDRIILDYNPTHQFWIHDKIQPLDNCVSIHSTYKDNEFLTDLQVKEIESNMGDANWWRVYGLGEVGQLDGLIYDFTQIDELPDTSNMVHCYGLDFGFTNDPTAMVDIWADTKRKVIYLDEVIYRTHMLNSDICNAMRIAGVPMRSVPIYADCAEPKSIAEISNAGYNIKPCDKDAPVKSDKLRFQIQFMQGWKICVTKRSVNLIKELRNYTWAKDKDGNTLNYPIDLWNHLLDATRYGVYTHLAKRARQGIYNISFT